MLRFLLFIIAFVSTIFASIPSKTYDAVGNITRIETPTQTIEKTYDALNRLKTVTDSQGTTSYEYDAIGRQTKVTYPNGVSTSYAYDSRNRVTKIEHTNSNGETLLGFSYTYDAVGNRLSEIRNDGRTVSYEYNEVNQLTKATVTNDPNGNNTTTTYAYDEVGNLISKTVEGIEHTYTYDANDRLISKDGITLAYDANGNLIDDGTNTYEWDEKNRLVKVTTPNETVEYTYDAEDNRIAKIVNGDTTTYLIDSNTPYAQVITESKTDGTEIHYTYGNDLVSNGSHYFLTDALGSTRGLVDRAESLTDSYDYKPYGELASHDGNSTNSFLFTGEQFDAKTGDYYLRARYYSPTLTRFLSRDTYDGKAADPLNQNHYLYAGGNPVLYVDPSGHIATSIETTNVSLVSGILSGIAQSNSVRIMLSLIQRMPAVVTSGVRGLARGMTADITHRGASLVEMQAIYIIARLYAGFGDHTEMDKIPVQVYGSNNLPEHQSHIFDSMIGLGSNGRPTSFVLHRKIGPRNDKFLDDALCTQIGKCRDEYPYNSTYEGGEENYRKGYVSVRYVSKTESNLQGGFMSSFYRGAPVGGDDAFIVIPLGGVSGYFDKTWKWHRFPK